ncbi:hypothetical protein ZIOFF_019995 [Zingiber officinale]|uniref:AtC3H23-like CCCH zinc finger domain-containing protein n=1 Tax=Zingiber officinale TaxID=94328 RepID=A0A8J5LTI8_ZINOF|nr:hypothetical protein ZIOFF_019995 [Zingiber officinale]
MVASTYGSLEVLKLILSLASIDVNCVSGHNTTTALHCAASGGSLAAVDVVKALLVASVDPTVVDADGNRPTDIIVASPRSPLARNYLEQLLDKSTISSYGGNNENLTRVMTTSSNSLSAFDSDLASLPPAKYPDLPPLTVPAKKEYPVDPTYPDIKNNIYATDEFCMFSFKIRPCTRAYSHDWTECPFVHPGENARRCDPRKYHYSCAPCPDFTLRSIAQDYAKMESTALAKYVSLRTQMWSSVRSPCPLDPWIPPLEQPHLLQWRWQLPWISSLGHLLLL